MSDVVPIPHQPNPEQPSDPSSRIDPEATVGEIGLIATTMAGIIILDTMHDGIAISGYRYLDVEAKVTGIRERQALIGGDRQAWDTAVAEARNKETPMITPVNGLEGLILTGLLILGLAKSIRLYDNRTRKSSKRDSED